MAGMGTDINEASRPCKDNSLRKQQESILLQQVGFDFHNPTRKPKWVAKQPTKAKIWSCDNVH
jgi:hypothetical protein